MQPSHSAPDPFRVTPVILLALLLVAIAGVMSSATSLASSRAAVTQLSSGDLGVTTEFVTSDTVIRTPFGDHTGADGIDTYLAALQGAYPDLRLQPGAPQVIGNRIVVDWVGLVGDDVALAGRTLIVIEDGTVAAVLFLSRSDVAPS